MAITHGVHDTDTHFIVDPITRAVKNDGLKKVSIVKDDHNSEVCTFELPRYIEGHDMSKCNRVEVHYLNTHSLTKETSAGVYVVADFRLSDTDPETVVFSWLVSKRATKHPGQLAFSLHFGCVDLLSDEAQYWWSSAINSSISVLDGINHTETEGGETEEDDEETDLQEKIVTPTHEVQVVRPDGECRGLSRVVVEPIPADYLKPSGALFVDANGTYSIRDYEKITVKVLPKMQQKEIAFNGEYTPDAGFDGLDQVIVNVAGAPATLQEKTVYPQTSDQSVTPDAGFDGLSKVTVEAMRLQSVTATENGEIIPGHGFDGLERVTVNVPNAMNLQSKSVKIEENGEQEVVADSGYDGLKAVKVKVDVPETGELQEKTLKTNGRHEPDEFYGGFEAVRVEVPQHVYTGEKYTGDKVPVYGGPNKNIVIAGYSASAKPADSYGVDEGALYSKLTLPAYSTSATGALTSTEFSLRVVANGDGTAQVGFCKDGEVTTGVLTYDVGQTGFKIKWAKVQPPDPTGAHPYGYADVQILFIFANAAGAQQIQNYQNGCIGFKSEAEYNAAVNLVYEPQGLIKINEELFFVGEPEEGTEA